MGQKVHPIGFRLGIYRDWDARWFAKGGKYGALLFEDLAIRKFLEKELESAEIAKIEIEKDSGVIRIVIHSARPGVIIGKKGQGIDDLRKKLAKILNKSGVEISVQEIAKPELDAIVVAKNIAAQLVKRVSYKRAMKKASMAAFRSGAKGIKVCCAGRLQGAEIARSEWLREGSVPLHTLRSNIDYGLAEAQTTYGIIGVKVWIYKGEYQSV